MTASALALALSACRGGPSPSLEAWRWDRPGTSEDAFVRDRHFCLVGATSPGGAVTFNRAEVDPERFATCMAARGYTRSDAGRLGAPTDPPTGIPRSR